MMQAAAWRSRDNKNANDSKLEGSIKAEANKRLGRVQRGARAAALPSSPSGFHRAQRTTHASGESRLKGACVRSQQHKDNRRWVRQRADGCKPASAPPQLWAPAACTAAPPGGADDTLFPLDKCADVASAHVWVCVCVRRQHLFTQS